jgi:hypothetical protein
MPSFDSFTTMQLITALEGHVHPNGEAIFNEIKSREIKSNDSDASEKHTGGVRPSNVPIVP